MKRFFASALIGVLLLGGCALRETQSRITACPLAGLQNVAFFYGTPASGKAIFPEKQEDGANKWSFGNSAGSIYMVCSYGDGDERLQLLPSSFSSCKASYDATHVSDMTCAANL